MFFMVIKFSIFYKKRHKIIIFELFSKYKNLVCSIFHSTQYIDMFFDKNQYIFFQNSEIKKIIIFKFTLNILIFIKKHVYIVSNKKSNKLGFCILKKVQK